MLIKLFSLSDKTRPVVIVKKVHSKTQKNPRTTKPRKDRDKGSKAGKSGSEEDYKAKPYGNLKFQKYLCILCYSCSLKNYIVDIRNSHF